MLQQNKSVVKHDAASHAELTQPCTVRINTDSAIEGAALEYAGIKWYPVPLHVPIIHPGGRTGCSCEAYKRSEKYREYLESKGKGKDFNPNYECDSQGKHPIGYDWETAATLEPDEIRYRFRQRNTIDVDTGATVYYVPNIGIATGPSNLLTLDVDSYKEKYDGGDFLSRDDKETPTAISGGGGEHLVYDRQGANFGNAKGELPVAGIDIRGVGGQFVVSPSLHKSGRRYQWEEEYSSFEIAPRPIPASLRTILESAHQQKQARQAAKASISFGTVGDSAPDLEQWRLPAYVLKNIRTPAAKGERSEHDFGVVCKLLEAGAGDDDILAIFTHYPVGTDGRYAESGNDYLARTIAAARVHLPEQEKKKQEIGGTIDNLRLWIRTHSFSELWPELHTMKRFKVGKKGEEHYEERQVYTSDSSDTKVADAVCDLMERLPCLTVRTSKRTLGALAGVGGDTALRALTRLHDKVFTVSVVKGEGIAITLRSEFASRECATISPGGTVIPGAFTRSENEYSPRKNSEPFLTGLSQQVENRVKAEAAEKDKLYQDLLALVPKGFGESCLRTLDALQRCGDMTAQEIADETGKTKGASWRALRRLEAEGLVESTQEAPRTPKIYTLHPLAWQRVADLAPTLRTAGLNAERESRYLMESQLFNVQQQAAAIETGNQEEYQKLEHRFNGLAEKQVKVLAKIYPQGEPDILTRMAYEVEPPTTPPAWLVAKMKKRHEQARLDVAEAKEKARLAAIKEAQTLRAQGVGKKEGARQLQHRGFTPKESWGAVNTVHGAPHQAQVAA